jgi:hypothetical protein
MPWLHTKTHNAFNEQLQANQSSTHDNPPSKMVLMIIGESAILRCTLSVCQPDSLGDLTQLH